MSALEPANTFEPIWETIKSHLEGEKNRVVEAIRSYPPPITACDEQFDQLLEDREAISVELARLHEAHEASQSVADPTAAIEEFICGSSCLNDAVADWIRSSLGRRISDSRT